MAVLPQAIADLVAADGIARQAAASDGTDHMLFRDGQIVRSCLVADWPAEQLVLAAHVQDAQDAAALRQRILTLAQSAVGIAADQLTAAQVRALFDIMLWKEGALDKAGVVQPLNKWV